MMRLRIVFGMAMLLLGATGNVSAQEILYPATPEMSQVYERVGFYFSLPKMVPVILLYLLWVFAANWVNLDTQDLKANALRWNLIVLITGIVGLALLWVIPIYPVALLLTAAALLAPALTYAGIRNSRVPESERVLTGEHLSRVMNQGLARLGMAKTRPGQAQRSRNGAEAVQLVSTAAENDEQAKRHAAQVFADEEGLSGAKSLMFDAIERRATDVQLEPQKDDLTVRYRIDGMLHQAEPFDRSTGDGILQIFKGVGGLALAEKRKPQQGSLQVEVNGRKIEVRVASRGTREGETMRLRILDKRQTISRLTDLGMRPKILETVAEFMTREKGLFLVAGPSGSGTTTTLYAALREIDRFQRNVISIEEAVEFTVENVDQIVVGDMGGEELVNQLRRTLRNDPEALMVYELREAPVAQLACQAAADRLVVSSVAANDTLTALFRLFDLQMDKDKLARVLHGVVAQRLVRKLCESCKEPYRPRPEFLKKANIPSSKVDVFYRPPREPQEVCTLCSGTGYYGRTGLFELLVVNDRMRKLIREDASVNAIKAEARKNGMLYLQEEGLRLVIRGVTSIQELMRVVK